MLTEIQQSATGEASLTEADNVPTPNHYSVTRKKYTDIDAAFIREWSSLCNRSAEPNAFLTPDFLIPAAQYLTPGERPRLYCVRDDRGKLVGFAPFHGITASKTLPLPHLRTLNTIHSFRSGLLVDSENVDPIITAVVDALAEDGWFAIEFRNQWLDSPIIGSLIRACEDRKYTWTVKDEDQRPGFSPSRIKDQYFQDHWSKNRRKTAKKNIKRLETLGDWQFRLVHNGPEFDQAIERFLELEHAGWKAGTGTSLRSRPQQEKFFTSMVRNFAVTNTAFFAELWLNDRVIGSSSNLISGDSVFAFKIGWDPEFAKVSPGTILESKLIQRAPELLEGIRFVDSCSSGDSYVGNIWPERMRVGSGLLTLKRRSRWIAAGFDQIKTVKRQVMGQS